MIDFIDLGCGIGGSIDWAKAKFGGDTYLGIDSQLSDIQIATDHGYNVILNDVTNENFEFPKARYITMLHLLEHLKNENDVKNVIKKSIIATKEFICIKVPYFDSYEYLKNLGFKLTWSDWIGHPTHITTNLLERIINDLGYEYKIGYLEPVYDSNSDEIIPYTAPVDIIKYDESLGKKEYTEFMGVYRETYCFININCPYWKKLKHVLELPHRDSSELKSPVNEIDLPPSYYLDLIRNEKPFSFARYGDGEMILMFNYISVMDRNIGDLTKAIEPMKQIFRNQYEYYHCKLNCTFHEHSLKCFNVKLDDVFDFMGEVCPNMAFYNGEIWQDLSFDGKIEEITKVLNPYVPVFIGGKHLQNLQHINGITNMDLIAVNDRKAWDDFDLIKEQIREKIDNGSRMFCFSMGYPGKIMIDELYPETKDKCFMIDFGSLWDPYCGILSRSGMVRVGFSKFQPYTKYKL